jgi:glucose/arabinose dehydrogenase
VPLWWEKTLVSVSVLNVLRSRRFALPVVVVLLLAGLTAGSARTDATARSNDFAFDLELVVDGLDSPVQVVDPGDGSNRLFVVEQGGTIRVIRDGQLLAEPFLDLRDRVSCCGERGLLSIAAHPDFAENGLIVVSYTDSAGDTAVASYRASEADPDVADPAGGKLILTVEQPAANHNGGLVLFGPMDGYLYLGLGDGGGSNGRNSQDPGTLLGKMLRIDIDHVQPGQSYAVPADNPLVAVDGARPEIWALGLRNPWRFSFDRITGDLWIGDVGSGGYEEVNFQPAASPGGENYGWDLMEGPECRADDGCAGLVAPRSGFGRDLGCVVTGGFVYHGTAIPSLEGVYLFADYCSGRVWGLPQDAPPGAALLGPVETGLRISSFGEDRSGEFYIVDLDGAIYRIKE